MTNPVNAQAIVDKMIVFLGEATDVYLKKDLVHKVTELAVRGMFLGLFCTFHVLKLVL